MKICRRAGRVSVVSEREVSVRFVTLLDDVTARNISEWHKIMEKRCQEEKKIMTRTRFKGHFMETYELCVFVYWINEISYLFMKQNNSS